MKHKQLALDALKADCEIAKLYFYDGKTCAIGRLALIAGTSEKDLIDAGDAPIKHCLLIRERIQKYFGLSLDELNDIQFCNDHYENREQRIATVTGYIAELPEE